MVVPYNSIYQRFLLFSCHSVPNIMTQPKTFCTAYLNFLAELLARQPLFTTVYNVSLGNTQPSAYTTINEDEGIWLNILIAEGL